MASSARSLRAALAVEAAGREVAEASLATTEAALRQAEAAFQQVLEAKDRRIRGLKEQVKVLQGKVVEMEKEEVDGISDEEEVRDIAENNNEKPTNLSGAKRPKFASTVAKEGVKIVLRGVKGTAGKRKCVKGEDGKEEISDDSFQKMESYKTVKVEPGKKKPINEEETDEMSVSKTESLDEAKKEEIEGNLKSSKENVSKSKGGKKKPEKVIIVEQDKAEKKPDKGKDEEATEIVDQVKVEEQGSGEGRVQGEVVCGRCRQVVATKESLRLHTCGAFMDTNRPEGNTRRRAVCKPVWRSLQL